MTSSRADSPQYEYGLQYLLGRWPLADQVFGFPIAFARHGAKRRKAIQHLCHTALIYEYSVRVHPRNTLSWNSGRVWWKFVVVNKTLGEVWSGGGRNIPECLPLKIGMGESAGACANRAWEIMEFRLPVAMLCRVPEVRSQGPRVCWAYHVRWSHGVLVRSTYEYHTEYRGQLRRSSASTRTRNSVSCLLVGDDDQ